MMGFSHTPITIRHGISRVKTIACLLFLRVAARNKTPPGEEPPWSARNFVPYWSQLLSKEAQRGAAVEILNRVYDEAADREAARLPYLLPLAGEAPTSGLQANSVFLPKPRYRGFPRPAKR